MKYSILLLLSLLLFTSCASESVDDFNIADSLKISVQLLAKEYEGTGHFAYDAEDYRYYGHWVFDGDPEREVDTAKVFAFERLEVGVPRITAPLAFCSDLSENCPNLYIVLDSEDTIEVTIENAGRNQLLMYHSTLNSDDGQPVQFICEQSFSASGPQALSVLPVSDWLPEGRWLGEAPVGNVHYINIRTSNDIGEQLVSARLKIETIEDAGLTIGEERGLATMVYGKNSELTRFCRIELLSFEYGDKYQLDE